MKSIMGIFEVGIIILKTTLNSENCVFRISDVFYLSVQEYAINKVFNYSLVDYEPENELPENSLIKIRAKNESGKVVELKWVPGSSLQRVFPHVSQKGWSKGIFIKLNNILSKIQLPDT